MLYLLDASAILNEPNFEFEEGHKYITTPEVINEFKSLEVKHLIENALHHGFLKIQSTASEFERKIAQLVKEKGFSKLSKPDCSILALALEFKELNKKEFTVLTDDYSIQNFLLMLEIPFSPIIQEKIKQVMEFELCCPACEKHYPPGSGKRKCDHCGTQLRKKPFFTKTVGKNVKTS